jgi:hypothetical protein
VSLAVLVYWTGRGCRPDWPRGACRGLRRLRRVTVLGESVPARPGGDAIGQSADQPLRGLTRHRYPDAGVGLIDRADHQHEVIAGIVLDRPKQPVRCRHRLLSRCNFRALPRRARLSNQPT